MKYVQFFLFLNSAICFDAIAQRNEVIATSGEYFKNSLGSVSWTLGELAIESYSKSDKILTQGFHQTRVQLLQTAIELPSSEILIYPNPVDDELFLHVLFTEELSYRLYDMMGRMLKWEKIKQSETRIPLNDFSSGIYLLEIETKASVIKIFKVLKQ